MLLVTTSVSTGSGEGESFGVGSSEGVFIDFSIGVVDWGDGPDSGICAAMQPLSGMAIAI